MEICVGIQQITCILCLLRGVQGLTLSSPLVVGNHITTCLDTNVVLTCTATQVAFLRWTSVPGVLDRSLFPHYFGTDSARIVANPYTLTLVNVTNHILDDEIADLTSTLEVMVDDLERTGTSITCLTPFDDHKHLTIYMYFGGPPSPPSNLMVVLDMFLAQIFSIILSWQSQEDALVAQSYRISINTTTQPVYTDMTTVVLEGEYNMPLEITITAENCAGTSEEVAEVVHVAGCSPPTAPVNGSVSEFTSSRVGAQVTYLCDTDLVLVGERVTTCSSPSLQWLPSSEEVMCVQPPEECGYPREIQSGVSVHGTTNNSVITFSCEPGYSLHGSTTSQCVSGEWTPSPQTVMCIADQDMVTPTPNDFIQVHNNLSVDPVSCQGSNSSSASSSPLSTTDVAVISAAVAGLCSFTAGLLLGVLLTRCNVHCHKQQKSGQTERPPVYEDIQPETKAGIELQTNEAYGQIPC